MSHIVLLEDKIELREEVAAFLHKRGWQVLQAGSLAEFSNCIAQSSFAIIAIIDVMLPDGSGFDAMTQLREQRPECGIIMLTARGTTADKLQGLYGGADHYLVKPVKLLELAAVVDALSRRVTLVWRLLRLARQLVAPGGACLLLSPLEMTLLDLFAKHPGTTVTRRQIAEAFGQDWLDFDQRRLDTIISRLRQRWRSAAGSELPLKTEHREGYSFAAPMILS